VNRLTLAARNNAEWCDAVARSWGGAPRFEAEFWINPGAAPPFYPNIVTLAPIEAVPAALAAAPDGFAVKDSFGTLELASLGFGPLFEAKWIWRDAAPPQADGRATWRIIRDAAALARWEAAWRDGEPPLDLFRPALLEARAHAFIAGEVDGRIVAGCIASRSPEVVGFSNLFGAAEHAAGCLGAVQHFAPGLPIVGYEAGAALEAMKSQGFQAIGPLRVWLRKSG
jgi:hypothetical protein